jgi:ABC-2 type transport system permease protein
VKALRLCLRGSVLQYRALFQWATPAGYLASKVMVPVFQLIFFVELGTFATGRASAQFFAIGNAIHVTALSGIMGVTFSVANQSRFGTLPALLGSPGSRVAIFLGPAVIHVLDGTTSAVLGFLLSWAFFGLDLFRTDLPLLGGSIVAVSFSTAGLGLGIGSLALVVRESLLLPNLVYFGLMFLCGVNFPVAWLPSPLQLVSAALPMTRGIQAARLAALDPAGSGQAVSLIAQELAVGLIYLFVGYLVFRLMEVRARQRGANLS